MLHKFAFSSIALLMTTGVWAQLLITQSTTLTADVTVGIVVARDRITLDCANHRVSAGGARAAIEVIGRTGVTVQRCFVVNSERGFLIADTRISTFAQNSANNNTFEGFRIQGSEGNRFIRNVVLDNGGDGFDMGRNASGTPSNGNFFHLNTAVRNGANGFEMDFSNHNVFVTNSADLNGQHGFSLDDSNRNYFSENRADRNRDTGFQIVRRNEENTFQNNVASGNNVLDAKQEEGVRNTFQNNRFDVTEGI